ncbi:hypothetical protein DIPPA_18732 [Diplonema papillatum]|nr:hypothetical protein DIPPA_18732 [Diplonema papillatum]
MWPQVAFTSTVAATSFRPRGGSAPPGQATLAPRKEKRHLSLGPLGNASLLGLDDLFSHITSSSAAPYPSLGSVKHRKVKGFSGHQGRPRSESVHIQELQNRAKALIRDDLNLRHEGKTWVASVVYSKVVHAFGGTVRKKGGPQVALALTHDKLVFLAAQSLAFTAIAPSSPGLKESRKGPAQQSAFKLPPTSFENKDPEVVGAWTVRKTVQLHLISGVVTTEADDKTLVLDVNPPRKDLRLPWEFTVIAFNEAAHKNDFIGYIIRERKNATAAPLKLATVSEPLLNVEYACRALSAVRLRRALDGQHLPKVDTEDDYCGMALNSHVAEFLRSKGDTTVKLSVRAELVRAYKKNQHTKHSKYNPQPAPEPVADISRTDIVLITTSSLYMFHESEREYKLLLHFRIENLVSVTHSPSLHLYLLHLAPKTLDNRILAGNEVLFRVRPLEEMKLSADDVSSKIQQHLEKVYLDVKIERLQVRLEKDVQPRSKFSQAVLAFFRFVSKFRLSEDASGRPKALTVDPLTGEPVPGRASKSGNEGNVVQLQRGQLMVNKWLLVIVKIRMFDLIDTFTNLNQSSSRDTGALIGRRLGLSLLALCAHLDLSYQLIYEAVLYEIMTCVGRPDGIRELFQKESFATRLISLHLGIRADQYARLVLKTSVDYLLEKYKPVEFEKKKKEALEEFASVFFAAFCRAESLEVIPHELTVVIAMIKKCASEIIHAGLTTEPLNESQAIGAFMMQRLWGPAIQKPDACGISQATLYPFQSSFLSSLSSLLNSALGYGHATDVSANWKETNIEQIHKYTESLVDKDLLYASNVFDMSAETDSERDAASNTSDFAGRTASTDRLDDHMAGELRRRQSLVNPTHSSRRGRSSTNQPKAFAKMRDKVLDVTDTDVKELEAYLVSLHEALGRDTERLLVTLMTGITGLNEQIAEAEQKVAAAVGQRQQRRRSKTWLAASDGSPVQSVSEYSEDSSFRTASPMPEARKKWNKALTGVSTCIRPLARINSRADWIEFNDDVLLTRKFISEMESGPAVIHLLALASAVIAASVHRLCAAFDPRKADLLAAEALALEHLLQTKFTEITVLRQEVATYRAAYARAEEAASVPPSNTEASVTYRNAGPDEALSATFPVAPFQNTTLSGVQSSAGSCFLQPPSSERTQYFVMEPGNSVLLSDYPPYGGDLGSDIDSEDLQQLLDMGITLESLAPDGEEETLDSVYFAPHGQLGRGYRDDGPPLSDNSDDGSQPPQYGSSSSSGGLRGERAAPYAISSFAPATHSNSSGYIVRCCGDSDDDDDYDVPLDDALAPS